MKAIFGKYEGTFNYTLDILGGETNWAQAVTMRNITSNEYSLLCDATNESDDIMHWSNMYSVTDSLFNSSRVICGYISARTKHSAVDGASASWGFRPAFEATNSEDCVNLNVGDVVTIGTLYVGSTPIKVPTNPTSGGDISSYGSNNTEKITLGDAIDDTDYQVKAVYVGNGLFVCSCNMLVNISCNQIRLALL